MTRQQAGVDAAGGFVDLHQRATIAAAMAPIIPTDDQPGAREAETIVFLDRYLSGIDFVYAKPDGSGFEHLEARRAAAWQQRIEIVRAKYVAGITELDRRSEAQFGVRFVWLTEEQQDCILVGMEQAAREIAGRLELAQPVAGFAPVEPALQQTSAEVDLDFFRCWRYMPAWASTPIRFMVETKTMSAGR